MYMYASTCCKMSFLKKGKSLQIHRVRIQTYVFPSCSFGTESCRNRQQMSCLLCLASGKYLCVSGKVVLWSIYFTFEVWSQCRI